MIDPVWVYINTEFKGEHAFEILKGHLQEAEQMMSKFSYSVKKSLNEAVRPIWSISDALEHSLVSRKSFSTISDSLTAIGTSAKGTGRNVKEFGDIASGAIKKLEKQVEIQSYQNKRFKMEWMSVMFLGMGIQRTFQSIGTTAIAEFKKATENTRYWSTALGQIEIVTSMVNIAMGETLNQILAPFADWLVNNIDMIIEFAQSFTDWIIPLTALGALMATGGALILGIQGVKLALAGLALPTWLAAGVVPLFFSIKGFDDISRGNVALGLGRIFEGWGLFLKGGLGAGLFIGGFILQIIDIAKDGKLELIDKLNLLFMAGVIGFRLGGPWGAGVAILLTLFITEVIFDTENLKRKMTQGFQDLVESISPYLPIKFTFPTGGEGDIPEGGLPPILDRQFGGVIPATGLYKMHAGEQVSNPSFSSSVNVHTGPVSSSIDVNAIARTVSSVIMRDVKRYVSPVSQYG